VEMSTFQKALYRGWCRSSECRDQFDLEVVMRRRRPRTKGERKAQCVINVSRSERQSITEHHGREICPYNDNDYCNSAP